MTKNKKSLPTIEMPSKIELDEYINSPYEYDESEKNTRTQIESSRNFFDEIRPINKEYNQNEITEPQRVKKIKKFFDETGVSDTDYELNKDTEYEINKLIEFFDKAGIDYEKFDPKSIPKLDIGKCEAYPNQESYSHIPGQHNKNKWLQSVRDIYYKEKQGINRADAIRKVTSGWNIMETFDFLNWLKFYESGEHMKYKFANLWYESPDVSNYALPIMNDKRLQEQKINDIDFALDTSNNERRQIIERQRNKIIGRLDSAEKLLRSQDGHAFSGDEFETLLEAFYQLKKKIHLINKASTATKIYDDMIIREANILHRDGFIKAANILYSMAQTPAAAGQQAKGDPNAPVTIPPAAAPTSPTIPQGAPGGTMGPGAPQGAPASGETQSIGINKFIDNVDTGNITKADDLKAEDDIDIDDADTEIMVSEAQALDDIPMTTSPAPAKLDPSPIAAPKPQSKPQPKLDNNIPDDLEVTEDDIKTPIKAPIISDFDEKVDAVLSGVTIADVIAKLENLAKFYKVREAPRQLAIVDIMLNSLGLSSYFPSLSEATNKSLDSNNYISSRVEDILANLRGAMSGSNISLEGGKEIDKPEVAEIKNKLKNEYEMEKNRKKLRKEQADASISGSEKETPEIEIEEDLSTPLSPAVAPAPAPTAAPLPAPIK